MSEYPEIPLSGLRNSLTGDHVLTVLAPTGDQVLTVGAPTGEKFMTVLAPTGEKFMTVLAPTGDQVLAVLAPRNVLESFNIVAAVVGTDKPSTRLCNVATWSYWSSVCLPSCTRKRLI